MEKDFWILILSVIFILLLSLAGSSRAMDPLDNLPCPPGFYFITYPFFYRVDDYLDKDGDDLPGDLGLRMSEVLFRFTYYPPTKGSPYSLHTIVPVGRVEITNPMTGHKESDSGLGDVTLIGAIWLGKSEGYLYGNFETGTYYGVGLNVDVPSGSYDKNSVANMGSNQWDIRPMLFYAGLHGPLSVDLTLYYNFRLENKSTDIKPGDEFWLETAIGYAITKNLRIAGHLDYISGRDMEVGGIKQSDTATKLLRLGPSVTYQLGKLNLLFKVLFDVEGENTPKGTLFWGRAIALF